MLKDYIRDRRKGRSLLLMTHAVAGYPSLEDNWEMLACMQEAGVDLVELQLPFSEPIADGPAFIRANQSALSRVHWHEYFEFLERASKAYDFPLLFMGYYNSVFCMGNETFCDRLAGAGGRGFIIADLPLEDSNELDALAAARDLDHIQIVTPLNADRRLKQIAGAASGFLYCVARKGVTGRRTDFDPDMAAYMQRCRSVTDLPLALGFGIRTPAQVGAIRDVADIAIVGTGALEIWEQKGVVAYRQYLKDLMDACA